MENLREGSGHPGLRKRKGGKKGKNLDGYKLFFLTEIIRLL